MSRFKGILTVALSVALVMGAVACSDDDTPTQDAGITKQDKGTQGDGKVTGDGPATKQDGGTTPTKLDCTKNKCYDYVIDRILMPTDNTTAQQYGLTEPGKTSKKNALGNILVLLNSQANLGLQDAVDGAVYAGTTLVLMRVQAGSLTSDTATLGQTWLGEAQTCCSDSSDITKCKTEAMTKCFGGSGTFKPDSKSPSDLVFAGKIASGKLTLGPAKMKLAIPLTTAGTIELNLKYVTLSGDITEAKMTNGVLNGAIPKSDLDKTVVPEVAKMVDKTYQDPTLDATTKKMIKDLFDTDGNGKISETEVKNNSLIKTFLAGDVDTDGDGEKELSLGVGFTAVKASITTN